MEKVLLHRHSEEFRRYRESGNWPLKILYEDSKRKRLVEVLCTSNNSEQQLNFFSDNADVLLGKICDLIEQKRPVYQRWTLKEENKNREISVPNKPFREFIQEYLLPFIKKQETHKNCHGGEPRWSVKKSLETHLPCESALSLDLKNAFQNTGIGLVFDLFYDLFSNLQYEERRDYAGSLSVLCTVKYSESRGLPQGSPASMAIFNRILYNLDDILSRKTSQKGLRYSRWVDDIVISSPTKKGIERFLGAIELVDISFPVSREKIFFQDGVSYLLGYKLINNEIFKNTKEEKLREKKPIKFDDLKLDYESWID